MTIRPLSLMPAAGQLSGAEIFYAQQSGADVKVTASQLSSLVLIVPSGSDDTAVIQAAINASETVKLGAGTFMITALTLGNYTKLLGSGNNETIITRFSGTATMITSATYTGGPVGLNATDKCIISDIRVEGGGTAGTGINLLNHSAIVMNRVIVSNCAVGYDLFQTQFCSFYSIMAYQCGVGLYLRSGSTGGANSNSFYDLRCVYGSVGVIVSGVAGPSFPQHSNYFRNPSLLTNSVCQFAAFGSSASNLSDVTIDGSANEASGGGPATYTYDSLVVKQASIYSSSASMNFMNSNLGEPADPCIILNSGSRLSISNLRGYAHTFGQLVQTDSTSICCLSGDCMFIGCIDGCTSMRASLRTEVGISGPPATFLAETIENDITTPSTTGTLTDATGTTSHTTGTDTFFGAYTQVTYAAGAGSSGSNRANFAIPCTAGRLVISFNIMSNINTFINATIAGDAFGKSFDLFAGVWTRITYVTDMASTGTQALHIFPWNPGGPVIDFCRFHARSGPITSQLISDINTVASGGYKPT